MSNRENLAAFAAWTRQHITGDQKGRPQIFLDRLFQAFGQPSCLDVGGTTEFRIRKSDEDGGGTAFADYVWNPVVSPGVPKSYPGPQKLVTADCIRPAEANPASPAGHRLPDH